MNFLLMLTVGTVKLFCLDDFWESKLPFFFLLWLVLFMPVAASASGLGVLSPNVSGPYIRVFNDIVRGIKKNYRGGVRTYVLDSESEVQDVERWLAKHDIVDVIALGNGAMNIALQLSDKRYRIVLGAVLSVPREDGRSVGGITMMPDPDLLFRELKKLSKKVQSVSVVYQFGRHDALIDRAKKVAAYHGLKIFAHGTDNAREGANLFKTIIDDHAPEKTAIWLLQGVPALKERSVLQSVLRKAWDQKIVVFSSNPSYVKRGALFSLYPNNFELGQSLAAASLDLAKGLNLGTRPSRELDSVLNTRTAEHLGLGLSRSRKRQFDILFPSE